MIVFKQAVDLLAILKPWASNYSLVLNQQGKLVKNILQIDFANKKRKATIYPGYANLDEVGHEVMKYILALVLFETLIQQRSIHLFFIT